MSADRTVRRWIKDRKLIAHRFGRVVRVARRDLLAFLAQPPGDAEFRNVKRVTCGKIVGNTLMKKKSHLCYKSLPECHPLSARVRPRASGVHRGASP